MLLSELHESFIIWLQILSTANNKKVKVAASSPVDDSFIASDHKDRNEW